MPRESERGMLHAFVSTRVWVFLNSGTGGPFSGVAYLFAVLAEERERER